jgi:hypothetical protein
MTSHRSAWSVRRAPLWRIVSSMLTRPGWSLLDLARRSPAATAIAAGALMTVAALDIVWAREVALVPVAVLIVLGTAGMAVTLLVGDYRGLQLGLVGLVAATALADLPVGRPDAGVEAVAVGALLVVLTEAVSWTAAARPRLGRRGRPAARRAIWVGTVALAGAGVGLVADALRHDLGGLGLGALALGALGAVGCVALVAVLARSEFSP